MIIYYSGVGGGEGEFAEDLCLCSIMVAFGAQKNQQRRVQRLDRQRKQKQTGDDRDHLFLRGQRDVR